MDEKQDETRETSEADLGEYAARAAVAVGLSAGAVLLLGLIVVALDIALVVFGGVLLAVLLRGLSDPIAARTPLTPGWSLLLVILLLVALVVGGCWLMAPAAAAQAEELIEQLPEALESLRELVERWPTGEQIIAAVERIEPRETLARAADVAIMSGRFLVLLFTFLFVGLFLAFRPALYFSGVVRLFPKSRRAGARDVLRLLGRTLRWFLIGRLLSMTMVGVSTAIVLAVVGVPLAAILGLLAGLLTFAPYLGPILGGVPILVVALIESPTLAVWAIVAYTAVQWLEGYLLDPLIQHRMVELPPALTVTAQVLLGFFAGGVGIAVATPLAAVLMVTVQVLWVRRALGDPVHAGPRGFSFKRRKKREEGA